MTPGNPAVVPIGNADPGGQLKKPSAKTARQRYVRIFPERMDFLLARLNPIEFTAYMRLLTEYAVRDGQIVDDDRQLARIAGLSRSAWTALREKLLALGVARVADGRWIDDDQQANLDRQREFAEKQRARAMGRWRPASVK